MKKDYLYDQLHKGFFHNIQKQIPLSYKIYFSYK